MQITKQQKPFFKRPATLVVLLLLAASLGLMVYTLYFGPRSTTEQSQTPDNTINYNPPTEQEKQESANTKEQSVGKPGQNQPPASSTLTISITRASQIGAGEPLNVRTLVTGATTGTCTITLTKAGATTVTKQFTIKTEATSATCNGDIAASDFNDSGEWQLTITAAANVSSEAASTKVVINK